MKVKQFLVTFLVVLMVISPIAISAASPYSDVSEKFWGYDDVIWVTDRGLMVGTSDTKFSPNTNMSRAMLAAVLWRYEGEPSADSCSFTDVKRDFWYTDSIDWAAENGIVYGMTETTFSPNGNITREQLVTILYRYANSINIDTSARDDLSNFADKSKVSNWASEAMQWAVAEELMLGITQGNVVNISPRGNATRAQVAAILHRFDKQTKCIDGKEHTIVVDEAVAPTCTETGLTEGKHCSVCDRVFIDQNIVSSLGHTDGEWIIDAEATCTEIGNKHQICSVCSVTINTEPIAAKGHIKADSVVENRVEPDCITEGSYDNVTYCKVCNEELSRKTIILEALGHTDGEWIIDIEATCTETGSKHKECTVCSQIIITEVIDSTGHTYEVIDTNKNDSNRVEITYKCTTCSNEYTKTTDPIVVDVDLSGTGITIINGSMRYERTFSVSARGGQGRLKYKYEVYASKSSSSPALTEGFSTSTSFGYSAAYGIDSTVLKVTVTDEVGNITVYRVYGSGSYIDSWTE